MKSKIIQPVLILHGGAGKHFKDKRRPLRIRKKLGEILSRTYEKLLRTDALDAVTYATQQLEDDPEFNAGTGSMLQADGEPRLTASIMDGSAKRFAAVINLEKIKNPILVARALLEENFRVLSGKGAFRFARKMGLKPNDVRTENTIRLWRKRKAMGSDTVGACALDRNGKLASATSTGGRGMETPGRVSDSGMPVADFADGLCAISATGHGEQIIDEGLAIRLAQQVQDGRTLGQAFRRTFYGIHLQKKSMGAIGLDRMGNVVHATTTDILLYGFQKGKKQQIF